MADKHVALPEGAEEFLFEGAGDTRGSGGSGRGGGGRGGRGRAGGGRGRGGGGTRGQRAAETRRRNQRAADRAGVAEARRIAPGLFSRPARRVRKPRANR